MLPDWLQTVLNVSGSSLVTGGSLVITSYLLLTNGRLYTRGQWLQNAAEHEKQLDLQKSQYEERINDMVEATDKTLKVVQDSLAQAITDRDAYRDALELERSARDALTGKVIDEIVPLVQVTNKHLDGIEKLAEGGDQ